MPQLFFILLSEYDIRGSVYSRMVLQTLGMKAGLSLNKGMHSTRTWEHLVLSSSQ